MRYIMCGVATAAVLVLAMAGAEPSFGIHFDCNPTNDRPMHCRFPITIDPVGIAVNDNSFFVVDEDDPQVYVFDLDGTFVNKLDLKESYDKLRDITAIAANNNRLFVANSSVKVAIFDLDGKFVSSLDSAYADVDFGTRAKNTSNGTIVRSSAIAVNNNYIFVVDDYDNQIKIFDLDGKYVHQFEASNPHKYSATLDMGIAANEENIFVVDSNHVHIFDLDGVLVTVSANRPLVHDYNSRNHMRTIAINDSHIFVSDVSDKIQVFKLDGTYVTKFDNCVFPVDDIKNSLQITYVNMEDGHLHKIGYYIDEAMGIAANGDQLFVVNNHRDDKQIFDWRCVGDSIVEIKMDDEPSARSPYSDTDFQIGKWLNLIFGIKY